MASENVESEGLQEVTLATSDLAEFRSLRVWLSRIPGLEVQQTAGVPAPGEQGATDVLTILASSGGLLAVAVQTLPDFIRSRRSDLRITVSVHGKQYTLQATNLKDVLPVIEKALDD